MKEFRDKKEIEKYYNKTTNTYNFIENGILLNVEFKFVLKINSDINAWNINAWDIDAGDINAGSINAKDINAGSINAKDINALGINAGDINYWAVCFASKSFKCKSIKGRRSNSKHFCLDNEIIFKKEEPKKVTIELTQEQLDQIKASGILK